MPFKSHEGKAKSQKSILDGLIARVRGQAMYCFSLMERNCFDIHLPFYLWTTRLTGSGYSSSRLTDIPFLSAKQLRNSTACLEKLDDLGLFSVSGTDEGSTRYSGDAIIILIPREDANKSCKISLALLCGCRLCLSRMIRVFVIS